MSWRPRVRHLGQRHGRYGLEYRYRCPRCHQTNLWWVPGRNGGMCWNCEALYGQGKLDLKKAQSLFKDFSAGDDIALLVEELNHMIKAPRLATTAPPVVEEEEGMHWKARWYLEKCRNIPLDVAVKAGTWYDAGRDKLHFPLSYILAPWGEKVACSMCRTPDPEVKDWRFEPRDGPKQKVWYFPLMLGADSEVPLVMVEGPFDILAGGFLGRGVALCGTQLHEDAHYKLAALRNICPGILLWLDPDEAGKAAARKIEKQIAGVLPVVRVDYSKEPGDCTAEEALWVARKFWEAGR